MASRGAHTAGMRVALLVLLCLLAGCRSTPPFRTPSGELLEGSVAAMETLSINGVDQSVWFRGRSTRSPIVILLHGGPGASEAALFRHFNPELERELLVVYWEQRGTGRSWSPGLDARGMTIEQLVADLDGLVDHVRRRFGQPKVALLGHSWGTVLGVIYAARHPQKVTAYIGVAQVVNPVAAQEEELAYCLAAAETAGDERALSSLRSLGRPPFNVEKALALERWTERYGGLLAGGLAKRDMIAAALRSDEANVFDLVLFGLGNRFSLRALWREYLGIRFDATHRSLDVPMLLVLGRHDHHVSARLAETWFQALDAPGKRLAWFERSAHNPPFEQPAEFNALVLRTLRGD
jgi:proline iminopeptidase